MTRYALVTGGRSAHEVGAYLPANYRVIFEGSNSTYRRFHIIGGEDRHGWTLDQYVLPRLASGLIAGEEISPDHPVMKEMP